MKPDPHPLAPTQDSMIKDPKIRSDTPHIEREVEFFQITGPRKDCVLKNLTAIKLTQGYCLEYTKN